MIIGYLLKRYRNKSGLSQRALSQKAAVRQAEISLIENGKKKDILLAKAERLAQALGISLEALLKDSNSGPSAALRTHLLAKVSGYRGEPYSRESIVDG